jgi:hypothetical protein
MPESITCPRCNVRQYTPYDAEPPVLEGAPSFPAVSRTDNKTYICSDCGNDESIMDFCREELQPVATWPVRVKVKSFGKDA